jgi:transglutaminase-like putative cysteine protease
VKLQAVATTQEVAAIVPTTPRQLVSPEETGHRADIIIQAQRPPTRRESLPITREDLAEYLQPTLMAPVGDPQVKALAERIAGAETDAYRAAQAVSAWVYENLEKVESEPRPITALQVLEQKRGDCSEHAVLAATLGRALGIPSRMVAGLACVEDTLYYHAWVEFYVGEWVEMDPTWDQVGVDALHLRLGESALDPLSFARMSMETGRSMGSLSLRVIEYELGP